MQTFTKFIPLLLLAGLLTLPTACKKDSLPVTNQQVTIVYGSEVVRSWNDLFLKIERYAPGYRPTPATRALACLGLSAYEACIEGMPNFRSQASQYPGLQIPPIKKNTQLHWPTVVNASYATLMRHLFIGTGVPRIEALEAANNSIYQAQISSVDFQVAQQYGKAVAEAVWEWSKTDVAGHDAYLDPFTNYDWNSHYNGPGNWVPTLPGPGKPMFSGWGGVRTFAIQPADRLCAPPGSDSLYAVQGAEIRNMSTNLTYDQLWIADFWGDDFLNLTFSAGPRWLSIANQVYANEAVNLETALYCNVKLGFALSDAAVACWYSKYVYNRENPVTLIQSQLDPNWKTHLNNPLTGETGISPAFPSYPSDHATFGAAAVTVLASIFGNEYAMTDFSHEDEISIIGAPRVFNSFHEMAAENAESRLISGVNFRMDLDAGESLGTTCGQKVNALLWTN